MDIRVETGLGQSAYPVIYFKMASAYTCYFRMQQTRLIRNVSECSIVKDFVLKKEEDCFEPARLTYTIIMRSRFSSIHDTNDCEVLNNLILGFCKVL